MQEHEIVSAVQQSAAIADHGQAQQAVRATLDVLGHRLRGGETADLASQLPDALADVLPSSGPGERFGVEEFYARVGEREGGDTTPQQARQHARAVAAALKVALSEGEFMQLVAQLPDEYRDLFGTEPVQHH
ncbi:Uncharacterized conserved protein, DUF2267 family [Pseudonocardia ammonioxydans]|uniref:Uncharacterized conserved protein, DUF2267 family n=1 Tax=Pseudonocardia ammonioxydans TaxID=260086 RepID=A0A1I5I0G1_PSUAM|nr:DUF2267 domain-containing protein [Pseudonocardia ammonioxydans]SFO54035.1 Uncharacterized conserved protein, DUF2267 family [Pseudonocardia ammonioxydans]